MMRHKDWTDSMFDYYYDMVTEYNRGFWKSWFRSFWNMK